MTEGKKLTRREAIKILGTATGAMTLANLPAKWTSPELSGGNIPAHAQTSCIALTVTLSTLMAPGIASIVKYLGPIPDMQTGAVYQYDDNFVYSGVPEGYSAGWYCQTGCLQLRFGVTQGNSSAYWNVNVYGTEFLIALNAGLNPFEDLLVDLENGVYKQNNDTHPSCSWT